MLTGLDVLMIEDRQEDLLYSLVPILSLGAPRSKSQFPDLVLNQNTSLLLMRLQKSFGYSLYLVNQAYSKPGHLACGVIIQVLYTYMPIQCFMHELSILKKIFILFVKEWRARHWKLNSSLHKTKWLTSSPSHCLHSSFRNFDTISICS